MSGKSVFQAVSDVMNDVRELAKNEGNRGLNFNFRGIDATMNAFGPSLRKHGVIVAPLNADLTSEIVSPPKGKPFKDTYGPVTFRIYGPEGDYFDSQVYAEGRDYSDKGAAKTMSVALRTCLLQTFCLPTQDEDPDMAYIDGHGVDKNEARSAAAVASSPANSAAAAAAAAGLGARPVPEIDRVKGEIVRIMGEDSIPPADILAMYHEAGGVSKTFADAQDLPPLKIVLEALGGA